MPSHHCPLLISDFQQIRRYIENLPFEEVMFFTEQIFNELTPAEKVNYDLSRFCSDYRDIAGRINFIKSLLNTHIISMLHIPVSYKHNPRLINLVRSKQYDWYIPIAEKNAEQEEAALTDDIESVSTAVSITNPRWSHADVSRKEESPFTAAAGDTLELLVDVKGCPEGAPVTFDIFDASSDPPMRIETLRGKNDGGTAKVSWTVSDPNRRGKELKLEFEGSARSKRSGRTEIKLDSLADFQVSF